MVDCYQHLPIRAEEHRPMATTIHPTGVNHLAIATRDIKSQIAYFTDVLGCPLRAPYRMHEAEGTWCERWPTNPIRRSAWTSAKPFRSYQCTLQSSSYPFCWHSSWLPPG